MLQVVVVALAVVAVVEEQEAGVLREVLLEVLLEALLEALLEVGGVEEACIFISKPQTCSL